MMKRYDLDCSKGYPLPIIIEDEAGDYVLFDDHIAELAALRAENDRLRRSAVCVYCGCVSITKLDEDKLQMMIEHMATCDKHPLNKMVDLLAINQDLVTALERFIQYGDIFRFLPCEISPYEQAKSALERVKEMER